MKMTKALVAVAAFAIVGSFATAEVTFWNKVSSDVVNIDSQKNGDSDTNFAGINNETGAEYIGEKVGFKVVVRNDLYLNTADGWKYGAEDATDVGNSLVAAGENVADYNLVKVEKDKIGLKAYVDGKYIWFKPIDILQLDFYNGYGISGASLIARGESVVGHAAEGDLGLRILDIVPGLTIAAGVNPFDMSNDGKPDFNIGAEYAVEGIGSFGAAAQNLADDSRTFGVFGHIDAVENLTVNAGFAMATDKEKGAVGYDDIIEGYGVEGQMAINASAQYVLDDIIGMPSNVSFDVLTNLGGVKEAGAGYDLYLGLGFGIGITDELSASLNGRFLLDFKKFDGQVEHSPAFRVAPEIAYTMGANTFTAGFVFAYGGVKDHEKTHMAIPVSWKYTFNE